jgi:hypothetical protein
VRLGIIGDDPSPHDDVSDESKSATSLSGQIHFVCGDIDAATTLVMNSASNAFIP